MKLIINFNKSKISARRCSLGGAGYPKEIVFEISGSGTSDDPEAVSRYKTEYDTISDVLTQGVSV